MVSLDEHKDAHNLELRKKIEKLRNERDAILAVHNYQRPEVQDMGDLLGDSLALAREIHKRDNKVVVLCGVYFMAESAAILNPEKTVLLPVKEAGCPLADMVTVERLREAHRKYPEAAVVCYINSTAEIKAESDICCTSANAVKVVKSLDEKQIIFIPDRNLADYVQTKLPEKEIIAWPGYCISHAILTGEELDLVRKKHPKAKIVVHPECEPEVLETADFIGGTEGMRLYVKDSKAKEFIIGTEEGMVYRMSKENPNKKFYLASPRMTCQNMKLTTLGWVAHALEKMKNVITVEERIEIKAKKALDRMLAVS